MKETNSGITAKVPKGSFRRLFQRNYRSNVVYCTICATFTNVTFVDYMFAEGLVPAKLAHLYSVS